MNERGSAVHRIAILGLFAALIGLGCSEKETHDLAMAVSSNDFEAAKAIIGGGGDVNCRYGRERETMLMLLSSTPDRAAVQFLLDNRANVNLRNTLGMTAVMYAALNGRAENARLLASYGADLNATANGGQTGLSIARARGFAEMVKVLLELGAKEAPALDMPTLAFNPGAP